MKQKIVAVLLCFFFGGWGFHKFYLGQVGWGILYLLFFWTYIPFIAAFVEFFILLLMSEEEFNRQFNPHMLSSNTYQRDVASPTEATRASPTEATQALRELKELYEAGIITPEEYEEKRRNLLRQL